MNATSATAVSAGAPPGRVDKMVVFKATHKVVGASMVVVDAGLLVMKDRRRGGPCGRPVASSAAVDTQTPPGQENKKMVVFMATPKGSGGIPVAVENWDAHWKS